MSTNMSENVIIDECCNPTISARSQPEIVQELQAQERQRKSQLVLRGAGKPEVTSPSEHMWLKRAMFLCCQIYPLTLTFHNKFHNGFQIAGSMQQQRK